MPRKNWSEGQEILGDDLSQSSSALERELYDRVIHKLMDGQEDVVFGDSFLVEYSSSTQLTVRAGVGFQTDGTQVDPEPEKRLIYKGSQVTKTITTPDATNPRIDIVSIKAARADTVTESRYFKSVGGTISSSSTPVETDWDAVIVVTAGTPAGSPAVPSTPAGYIKIAEVAVAAVSGIAGSSSITDKRPRYKKPSSYHSVASKSASYSMDKDDELVKFDCTSGALNYTLLAASLCAGKKVGILKSDGGGNAVTLVGTVSGETNPTISTQYDVKWILSTGTEWIFV